MQGAPALTWEDLEPRGCVRYPNRISRDARVLSLISKSNVSKCQRLGVARVQIGSLNTTHALHAVKTRQELCKRDAISELRDKMR